MTVKNCFIAGDYFAKIVAQENFEDQLEVAERDLSLRIATRGEREFYYSLTHDELEKLKTLNIQETYLQFESRLVEHCRRVLGRRMLVAD